ncbi:MAG: hypothetical protein J5803_00510, partial [Desulfovibrio sp.]|nr:hypothetical protein [Desulfovibrio sp.]
EENPSQKRAPDFWSNIENPPVFSEKRPEKEGEQCTPFLFSEALQKEEIHKESPISSMTAISQNEPHTYAAKKEYSTAIHVSATQTGLQEEFAPSEKDSHATQRMAGNLRYLGQLAQTYLLFEDNTHSLILVDQHAAHERVLYERLVHGAFQGQGQTLLLPIEMALHPSEQERLMEIRETIQAMGYVYTVQGTTLTIQAVPPVLTMGSAKKLMQELLDGKFDDHRDMFKTMACKAAIKAGQSLTLDEVDGLITQWLATEEKEYCPHGRPTVITWDSAMLERAFKRK